MFVSMKFSVECVLILVNVKKIESLLEGNELNITISRTDHRVDNP